jgi:2-polyprenyl-3-methyl-5-hydroxy-6-metoxy-1,4-benzoquinol methylase
MEHNNYHERIVEVLSSMVKPDWRILDIGAGNGMLSLPLCAMGFLSTGYSKKDTDFSTKRKWT